MLQNYSLEGHAVNAAWPSLCPCLNAQRPRAADQLGVALLVVTHRWLPGNIGARFFAAHFNAVGFRSNITQSPSEDFILSTQHDVYCQSPELAIRTQVIY
jgi:hypothetical protein